MTYSGKQVKQLVTYTKMSRMITVALFFIASFDAKTEVYFFKFWQIITQGDKV